MKFFAPALVLAYLSAIANAASLPVQDSASNSISSCGSSSDLLTIDSIQYSPNPPVPGQALSVSFKGSLSDQIPDGTEAVITVKLGALTLINQTVDFCSKVAPQLGQTCPVPKGQVSFSKQGDYDIRAVVTAPGNKEVMCIDGNFSL
ncbi:Phosphatidylglycerol/phosphatidylinositol transfer protein [Apophysomyces sp. BC1015]|nr:Phosphatidylglycerol/phosphatidylinositol transfer protein [Apophysomyces sp. BC1015]